MTFLGAGHETTASGLAWVSPPCLTYFYDLTCLLQTLWLLAAHPEVQDKLRAEVSPVLAQHPNPDFRTLKGMEYLNQVVYVAAHTLVAVFNEADLLYSMESLRVYPPVPMTIRQAQKSDYVDGVWVPKGTLFYIGVCEFYMFVHTHLTYCHSQIRVINTCQEFWGEDAEE